MDLISNLLRTFHLNATVFERSRFCGSWRLDHPGRDQASFHLIVSGHCWLDPLDGSAPMRLDTGDLLVLPRDAPHRLSDRARAEQGGAPDRAALADTEAGGTGIICGYFVFDEGASNPVLDALPEYLLLRADEVDGAAALRAIVALLVDEASAELPGSDALVDRLSDALFIQVVRQYFHAHPDESALGAALSDPAVHRALECLHSEPARSWDLDTLAREAAISRSALVQRFSDTMGVAPMQYLQRWRLKLAHRLLSDGYTVTRACDHVGYRTEAGFSKAFKRQFGHGPGAVRRAGNSRRPGGERDAAG
ncbi:AraC family transcriptional regulator [Ectothiorhodospiraceae bacterium WFHF3C12]|nr:AraC family transcriptional regulator [Ectothiorhodospiraceae bacterium WFHF3C12]